MTDAFVGIDVAIAKKKRLPVCLLVGEGDRLRGISLKESKLPKPPCGEGNRAALDPVRAGLFAQEVLIYLQEIERRVGVSIRRIALDCPAAPRKAALSRRKAERALDGMGISSFPTPSLQEIADMRRTIQKCLAEGCEEQRMPRSNQIWMIVGFQIFDALSKHYDCRKVYPQAIVRVLGCKGYKRTTEGYNDQFAAAAKATGTSTTDLSQFLSSSLYGSNHDRLDAFLSAWVASLGDEGVEACGDGSLLDTIWIPKVESNSNEAGTSALQLSAKGRDSPRR